MLYLPHFLVGTAILKLVPNPIIGLPLAFASHIALDLTPHNDFDLRPGITFKEFLRMEKGRRNLILGALSVDYIFTGIAFIWVLVAFRNPMMLAGGIVGVSPDAVEQLLMLLGMALPGWQDKLQNRVSMKYGFISYPIVSLAALYLLLK
jgi:hypothetical protein